jgi:shikimate kinase
MTATPTLASENPADLLARLGSRSIVFVGLMGAGKTAIGRKVAAMLGLPFTDSDHEIESVSRMTIPDLFERYGEAEFRSLEQRVIVRVLESGSQVLSTGGGAFMNEQTRDAIAAYGLSVWLKADVDTLLERVSKKQNRPLLKNADPRAVLEKLMMERYPVYALADVTVQTRDERKEVIAGEVIGRSAGIWPATRRVRGASAGRHHEYRDGRGPAWRPHLRHSDRRRPRRASRRGDCEAAARHQDGHRHRR